MRSLDWVLKRQVASRFFVSLLTMIIAMSGFVAPEAYHYRVLHTGGLTAYISNGALLMLAGLAFFDTLLNDIAGDEWHFRHGPEIRHILWGWIGATYIGYALILTKHDRSGVLTVFFVTFGLFCASIAALDTAYDLRKRKNRCTAAPSTALTQSP